MFVRKIAQGACGYQLKPVSTSTILNSKRHFFALQCFETKISNKHARLLLDNSTAVACINNMDTNHSVTCNQMAFSIWLWCRDRQVLGSVQPIFPKRKTQQRTQSPERLILMPSGNWTRQCWNKHSLSYRPPLPLTCLLLD